MVPFFYAHRDVYIESTANTIGVCYCVVSSLAMFGLAECFVDECSEDIEVGFGYGYVVQCYYEL